MDSLLLLIQGFGTALQPENLFWAFSGVMLGTAVGILPGIGPTLIVALLLPVTYELEPVSAFIMFAGIYYGAMYGGSTTSILMNTPGESGSIITALEGNKMARAGRASAALATAAIGSFVAGTLGTIGLTFAAPLLARFALSFGPAEYFALMVLGFTTISAVLGDSTIKGIVSLFFGLALGLVGIDLQTGQARYTLGLPQLLDGIHVVVVVVGLFAVGETLYMASRPRGEGTILKVRGWTWMTRSDWARSWKPWLRGTALGFPIGALPTGGAEVPTFLSYLVEKRLSKKPEEFGKKGGHRGRGRAGGGEQRRRSRGSRSVADVWFAHVIDRRHFVGRFSAIQPSARASHIHDESFFGLGTHRQSLRGQPDAVAPEPAAGAGLGAAAYDSAAATLWGHPRLRHAGNVQLEQLRLRCRPHVPYWYRRLRHASRRDTRGPRHHRHDLGPIGGTAIPASARDFSG